MEGLDCASLGGGSLRTEGDEVENILGIVLVGGLEREREVVVGWLGFAFVGLVRRKWCGNGLEWCTRRCGVERLGAVV